MGLESLHQVSGDARYLDALKQFGQQVAYGPGPRVAHADDHAVLQAWLGLYQLDKDPAKLKPSVVHFDKVLAALSKEAPKSISGGTFTWCWCDALFMSPAVWARLSQITGDPKFLAWADREWWTTTDVLYDPAYHLYYRDNSFFTKRTPSGRKVFWARGNGWVTGGLVHVLDRLPANHPSREKYLGLYHDMMFALLKLQNQDGLWRSSLLDPEAPQGESSGSAFFVYAMAWGLNRGLLPGELSGLRSSRAIRRWLTTSRRTACSGSCRRSATRRTSRTPAPNPPKSMAPAPFSLRVLKSSACSMSRSAARASPRSQA